ncbi:MAG: hypothetical protein RLZZ524_706 [Pseudomonadota bacterium]
MAGDASFASVSTLLHLDTSPVVDVAGTPKTYTLNGGAAIGATAKFGAGGLSLTGGNSYISTPYHIDFDNGTGQFTIEFYVRFNSFSAAQTPWSRASGSFGVTRESALSMASNVEWHFYYGIRGTSSTILTFTVPTMAINTWYKVAITRDASNVIRLFLDGTPSANTYTDSTNLDGGLPLYIGAFYAGSIINPMDGFIDEFRWTKGVCRYNASYTVPTEDFIAGLGQVSGEVRDGNNALCARTVRAYRRDTGALVGSTTSDSITGAYTIDCATLDEVTRIVLDDASSPLYNDIVDRVIPA